MLLAVAVSSAAALHVPADEGTPGAVRLLQCRAVPSGGAVRRVARDAGRIVLAEQQRALSAGLGEDSVGRHIRAGSVLAAVAQRGGRHGAGLQHVQVQPALRGADAAPRLDDGLLRPDANTLIPDLLWHGTHTHARART